MFETGGVVGIRLESGSFPVFWDYAPNDNGTGTCIRAIVASIDRNRDSTLTSILLVCIGLVRHMGNVERRI